MNVGIIGAGFFGEMHALAIKAIPGLRLISACRTNREALKGFCKQFGIQGYTDYRELLSDPTVDIVVIATPHSLHTPVALEAAQQGKHMLIEKPMALSLHDCDAIIAAQQKNKVKLMVGHINRFSRAYTVAKEIIESGEVGEIVIGMSTMSKYWMEHNRRPWHLDRQSGGGMLLTAGIHCLDRLIWLVESRVLSVSAKLDTRFHKQEADDAGLLFLRFENGSFGTVVSTGYKYGAPKHLTELTCTKGVMNIDFAAGVSIGKEEKWEQVKGSGADDWMHEALVEEWKAFTKSIEHNADEPVPGSEARHYMQVIFGAELSSKLNREIDCTGDFDDHEVV